MRPQQKQPKQSKKTKKAKAPVEVAEAEAEVEPAVDESVEAGPEVAEEDVVEVAAAPDSLAAFNLPQAVIQRLQAKGIASLFPVQVQSYQHVMSGCDLIVQSRTGTGKTLAFALPIVVKLMQLKEKQKANPSGRKQAGRAPRVLVLAPTRELAKQIADDFAWLCPPECGLSVLAVYGGVPYEKHRAGLAAGVDVVVGAPGRVMDLAEQGCLRLDGIRRVVLDEVDRMLDMGFRDSVDQLLGKLYAGGGGGGDGNDESAQRRPQTLLFSATLPAWVEETASKYLDPATLVRLDLVSGDGHSRASQTVQHLAILSPYQSRSPAIADVIRVRCVGPQARCIVFCERKRDADELASHAAMSGDCHVLHGDIPQDKRELVLQKFRDGKYRVLVTTDVAARGLDIPHVDLVVLCHPPKDTESYIHRAGRTGRAGRAGAAVTFYTFKEEMELKRVERQAGIRFKRIGAPTAADLAEAAGQNSLEQLRKVPDQTVRLLAPSAAQLIAEMGAERALAAALALLSGQTEILGRSLLSAREGFTAYVLHTTADCVRGKGYLYVALRRCLDPEQVEKVQYATFSKDRKSLLFDLPANMEQVVEKRWTDGRFDRLEKLTELPELEEADPGQGFGQRPGGGGGSGYRNGGGGYYGNNNNGYRGNSNGYHGNGGNGYHGNNNGYHGNGGNKRPFNGGGAQYNSTGPKRMRTE